MRVHKPADAMLLLGYQSRGGQSSLTVTVGYCRGIDGVPVSEQDAWKTLAAIFTDEPFDLSQKKLRRGYGVAGSAKAPQGKPVTGLTVRAGVGPMQKSVLVLGDRYWTRGIAGWQASAPQPFTDMPIGLARAYGAKPFTANPHGRGHSANADQADGAPLPNIEDPNAPVLRPADAPQPATLGVLAQSDPLQVRWLGTLDKRWERERLPWLPDDTDPRWFDRFPQDQCQDGYWRGDESWFAENMNAERPVQRGALPALRPRLLARSDAAPDRRFELPLDLDTVWLLPNEGQVLVLYRAELATRREDAEDVLGLGVFTERMAEPAQATQHWAAVWQQADEAELQAAPMPAVAPPPEAAAKAAAAGKEVEQYGKAAAAHRTTVAATLADSRQSALAEAEQTMQRHGFGSLQGRPPRDGYPVDASSLPLPPAWPKEPVAFKAAVKQYVADSLAAGEAENRKQWKAYGLDYDAAMARAKARPAVELDPADAITKSNLPADQKAALLARYKAFQIKMDALQLKAADMNKQAAALQQQAQEPPILPVPDEALPQGPRTVLDRETLLQRHAQKSSARWSELKDLDLAGVDLAGLDLNASVLRKCNLRGADLEGVDFTECQFDECDFGGARLGKARFTRARLKGCQAASATAPGADFTQARLEKCVFTQADLSSTQWVLAQSKECDLEKANLRQARGREASFIACRLPGADAAEAEFPRATFSKCMLEGATLDGASLEGATLMTCQAAGSRFDGARLAGLRTLKGTDLRKANLNRAQLDKASLQDTDLGSATLREAKLDRGFLKNCDLTGTDAWHLVARTCDFTGSRIVQASWRGANLMKARLRQVLLQDVDLTGANLHAADTRTAKAQGVQLEQALLTRCRLLEDYARE